MSGTCPNKSEKNGDCVSMGNICSLCACYVSTLVILFITAVDVFGKPNKNSEVNRLNRLEHISVLYIYVCMYDYVCMYENT